MNTASFGAHVSLQTFIAAISGCKQCTQTVTWDRQYLLAALAGRPVSESGGGTSVSGVDSHKHWRWQLCLDTPQAYIPMSTSPSGSGGA
jgi:hypothetical protein